MFLSVPKPDHSSVATTFAMSRQREEWPWFAVRVKSNREKITSRALRGQGYEELVPTFRRSRSVSGRVRIVESPLFPGYVFSRFDKNERLPILMIPGVLHVVGIGKEPMPVDSAEIASIRAIVNSPLCSEPWPFVKIGQQMEIAAGPLAGAKGVILGIRGKYRLIASLTLLQRSVAVEIERDWVRPCPRNFNETN